VWTRQTSHEVVAVSGWGGDGRDDGVCAGVSIVSRIVAVRVCGCVHAAVNCLDLCSVAFAFENCNAFHTFKVPRFPVPRFPPRATWSRVFQSRLFHPSNLVPGFPVPRFQRPLPMSSLRREDWRSATVINSSLVDDPTVRPPGFHLRRRQWSLLNRFADRTGSLRHMSKEIRFDSQMKCVTAADIQTMSHIVDPPLPSI